MIIRNTFLFIRIISFISSIFPFSLYIFLEYRKNDYEFWGIKYITPQNGVNILIFIQIISILYIIYFFKLGGIKSSSNNKRIITINSLKKEKDGTTNYILANVLPIATIEMDTENKAIFVIILLILLGYMYVKNDLFYINPIFDLIGVKVYECSCKIYSINLKFEEEFEGRLISNINIYSNNNKYYKVNKTPNEVLFVEDTI